MNAPADDAEITPPHDAEDSGGDFHRRLEAARRDLLELSTRNRLLSTPRHRKRSRALEIVGERSDDVFRLLVHEARTLTFDPAPEPPEPPDPRTPRNR